MIPFNFRTKRNLEMKVAEAKELKFKSKFPGLEEISARLDDQKKKLFIDTLNWKGYDYKPEVSFEIAYSTHEIFLKRENSTRANPQIISKIRRQTSVGTDLVKEKKGEFKWTITIAIPFEVFFHHKIKELKGRTFRANFYKCGDMLSVPHYITWNPIGTENPDYHQPKYFGEIKFI